MHDTFTTRIGSVHLKVHNLQRAINFYVRYLHLRVVDRIDSAYAFLATGDGDDTQDPYTIALQAVGSDAPESDEFAAGLYHIAFAVPDRQAFATAYRCLQANGMQVEAVNHRTHWALYFRDPDGNGLKLYWDTRSAPESAHWQGHTRLLPENLINGEA